MPVVLTVDSYTCSNRDHSQEKTLHKTNPAHKVIEEGVEEQMGLFILQINIMCTTGCVKAWSFIPGWATAEYDLSGENLP